MKAPYLEIDLEKLRQNAERMVALCGRREVDVTFITKGFCADPKIIGAVREGGVRWFGDSRIANIRRAKEAIPDLHYLLIRIPMLSEAEEVVRWADWSLQSDITVIRAVSDAALCQGKVHKIILMMDVGDLREGVFGEEELRIIAPQIKDCPGVELVGVGSNVGCYGSIMPSVENTAILTGYRDLLNRDFGFHADKVCVGGTCALKLIEEGRMPAGINMIRVGEGILYGEDTTNYRFLDKFYQDAFTFYAEVSELRQKPSVPIGERGRDGFGRIPEYEDRGIHWRAICGAGKQDVSYDALTPLYEGAEILGASCDHMILDVEECIDRVRVGDVLPFRCGYAAAFMATTSPYVERVYRNE